MARLPAMELPSACSSSRMVRGGNGGYGVVVKGELAHTHFVWVMGHIALNDMGYLTSRRCGFNEGSGW